MKRRQTAVSEGVSIRAVSSQTGLSTEVLRIWEYRYGWPKPSRDTNGYRLYGPETVALLHLVAAEINRGLSISDVLKDPVLRILEGGPVVKPKKPAPTNVDFVHIPRPASRHAAQLRDQLEQALRDGDRGRIELLMAQAPLIRPDEREMALLAPHRHWNECRARHQ